MIKKGLISCLPALFLALPISAQPHSNVASVTTSVLNTGTWFKIAVANTGICEIDKKLIMSMGLNPANVNPANVRVFGNGGNMLSEDNAVARPQDLIENAVWVSDNGNGAFDDNDFVAFYAVGPTAWKKDSLNQRFVHLNNIYSDSAYYFVTVDQGPAMQITTQGTVPTENETITSFNDYVVHDLDLVNPAGFGREWYGEQFGGNAAVNTQPINLDLGGQVDSVVCAMSFASVSNTDGNVFTVSLGGQNIYTDAFSMQPISPPADPHPIWVHYSPIIKAACNNTTVDFSINYTYASGATATGYLNFIELNYRRQLSMAGNQMGFRDWRSAGTGNIAKYELQSATASTQVWDVTDPQHPVKMNGTLNGTTYSFSQSADMLHEFIAVNGTNLLPAAFAGPVANQNLHGTAQADYIIVSAPEFMDAANQLAMYHQQQDNLRTLIVTPAQIYNEFSSGGQDLSAIRDFMRMLYVRAGNDSTQMPHYLMLIGTPSYDYKNRIPGNINLVPSYESLESSGSNDAYCTDDFFGFLDDNDNIESGSVYNILNVSIGRLPVRDATDAANMVNKVVNYKTPETLGPWRISSTFVADDNDYAGQHLTVAEVMAATVGACSSNVCNDTKVYLNNIPIISTPAGPRCPNANAAIDNQVYKGTSLINYNGHGNIEVLAQERILTVDDINTWNNRYTLPFMVTGTCEFGTFDHPQYVSAAARLALRNNGGVIAILTTTAPVYSDYNRDLNRQYLQAQFSRLPNGNWNSIGDASRMGKNITYQASMYASELANYKKFSFLGDPAVIPDFPQYYIHLSGIKDATTMQPADTIGALGSYIISGSVTDVNNSVLSDFNGTVSIVFFDKPRTVNTITGNATFQVQDNIVYKGKVSVSNGQFSFAFIAPKDINYSYGTGKISTYADNGITDAAGADTTISVGGFSDNPVISNVSPVVHPFMNDSLFINGGITGNNSVLFVELESETGINVSGNNVGHDLLAVLDGNEALPYILNDYYETAPNTYKRGYVSYLVSGLADGKHSLTVRAWDVNDNEAEGTVDFVVVDGKVVQIQNLMSYPNPFKDVTHIVFEHNHPNEELNVSINIYSSAGGFVRNIKQVFTPSGSRSAEIEWSGTNNDGVKMPSGVYVYRIKIATDQGIEATAYQKLVLVR